MDLSHTYYFSCTCAENQIHILSLKPQNLSNMMIGIPRRSPLLRSVLTKAIRNPFVIESQGQNLQTKVTRLFPTLHSVTLVVEFEWSWLIVDCLSHNFIWKNPTLAIFRGQSQIESFSGLFSIWNRIRDFSWFGPVEESSISCTCFNFFLNHNSVAGPN